MRWRRLGLAGGWLGLALAVVALAGCVTTSGTNPQAESAGPGVIPEAKAEARTHTTPTAVALAASANADSQDYKIAPRDVLQVTVFQVPDLNRTVQVDNTGFITLPLINSIHVGGMTMRQAQDEITKLLGKSYLRSPQVTLSLVKSGQRVTINGAVKTPQVLTVDGELTLSQAIAQAGGTNEVANADRIHVARVFDGHVSDEVYDLTKIQSGQATDPSLRGGDIVVVEDSQAKVAFKNVKDLLPFAVIGTLLSDAHVKRDVRALYVRADGIKVYRYRYRWSDVVYVGVIAQQVKGIRPDAVIRGVDGLLRVKYARLGMTMETCKIWMAMRGPTEQALDCFRPASASVAPRWN